MLSLRAERGNLKQIAASPEAPRNDLVDALTLIPPATNHIEVIQECPHRSSANPLL